MCSPWVILFLVGFIFLITYDPRKGTIHKRFIDGPQAENNNTEPDPLRWKPTSGMYDPVGAIFNV